MAKSAARGLTCRLLPGLKGSRETLARSCLVETQAARPFFAHLDIALRGQCVEQILTGLLEMAPFGVRIQFRKTFGERTAAAKRNAQVVYGFDRQIVGGEGSLFADAAERAL